MSKLYFPSITVFILLSAASAAFSAPVSSLMCANPGSTTASPTAGGINANSCTDFSYAFPATQPSTGLNNWQYGYYQGSAGSQLILDPSTFALMAPTPAYDANGTLIVGQTAGWWSQNFSRYWTALDAFEGHSNASYTDLHQPPYCNQALYQNCGTGLAPGSPNSTDSGEYWAARRYIIPSAFSGLVNINVSVEKDPRTLSTGAQGVTDFVVQVSGGHLTVLACVNVPVNGVLNPSVTYPSCGTPASTPDPLMSGQPIYTIATATTVAPGDFIDLIQVPNYNTALAIGASTVQGHADFSSGVFQLETLQAIPEPATFGVLAAGLLALGLARRRRIAA